MERLTKLSSKGDRYVSAIGSGAGCWTQIVNRLAAYENTGISPEKVEIMRETKSDAQFMLTELCRFCDYDRLEELAKAEKEGRVEVLPCKLGTTVYCVGTPCGDCVCFNEPMTEAMLQTCRNCERKEIVTCSFDHELIPEFGKTVFLTREEAEASMRKEG